MIGTCLGFPLIKPGFETNFEFHIDQYKQIIEDVPLLFT